MYAAIWHALPGPRSLKAVVVTLLVAAVVTALFTWVFPALADDVGLFSNTVG